VKTQTRIFPFFIPGVLLVLLGWAGQSAAVDFYLIAKSVEKTMPDGTTVPMWGFAEDPGGACYTTTPIAARRTSPLCLGPVATVPGPRLTVAPNIPNVRIFVTNLLPEPVSVIIPGQEMPYSTANNGPTWTDGTFGPRTNATQRVRSFGREANPNGGRRAYRWNNARQTSFKAGSFLYHSGTHPQVQVQMGLYGAISRDAAAGEAYAGIGYDASLDLLFSEIDTVLHTAVNNGTYGTTGPTSTLSYQPNYFLINGEAFSSGSTCIDAGLNMGDHILLRMMNAGLRDLVPMMLGTHFQVVAEGGNAYQFARDQYSVFLAADGNKDVIWTPALGGDFHIIERRLSLTNHMQPNGGMQTCITVAGTMGINAPPVADAGGPYTAAAGDTILFDASNSTDDGTLVAFAWDFGDGATGSGQTVSHVYAGAGSYTVTLVVTDDLGVDSTPASTTVTITAPVDNPPTADPGGPYSGRTGVAISFDGSNSSDPENQPLTYSWDFGDGNSASGAAPTHTYSSGGTYTVTLTVNDSGQDSAPASTTATISDNNPPVADPGGPYDSTNVTVTFNGTASSDLDSDPLTYNWNFGDGGPTEINAGPTPTHSYSGPGTYTVTLVVNDGFEDSAASTTTVTITASPGNNAPVAVNDAFNPDQVIGQPVVVNVAGPLGNGVLANDTDGDSDTLTAQLINADELLQGLQLNSDGSFSWSPGENVGTWSFTYYAFDGTDVSNVGSVNVTREIRLKTAEYNGASNRWKKIEGSSSAIGSTITIYLGPVGGTVIGTATVGSNGNWLFSQIPAVVAPSSGSTISVDNTASPGGAVSNFPVNCKNCP
jgi:PKD repeat protein